MRAPKGKVELALLLTLREIGISIDSPGKWSASVALARLIAAELDAGEHPSASLIAQYRVVLDDLMRSKVVADGPAVGEGESVLRRLRSV